MKRVVQITRVKNSQGRSSGGEHQPETKKRKRVQDLINSNTIPADIITDGSDWNIDLPRKKSIQNNGNIDNSKKGKPETENRYSLNEMVKKIEQTFKRLQESNTNITIGEISDIVNRSRNDYLNRDNIQVKTEKEDTQVRKEQRSILDANIKEEIIEDDDQCELSTIMDMINDQDKYHKEDTLINEMYENTIISQRNVTNEAYLISINSVTGNTDILDVKRNTLTNDKTLPRIISSDTSKDANDC